MKRMKSCVYFEHCTLLISPKRKKQKKLVRPNKLSSSYLGKLENLPEHKFRLELGSFI